MVSWRVSPEKKKKTDDFWVISFLFPDRLQAENDWNGCGATLHWMVIIYNAVIWVRDTAPKKSSARIKAQVKRQITNRHRVCLWLKRVCPSRAVKEECNSCSCTCHALGGYASGDCDYFFFVFTSPHSVWHVSFPGTRLATVARDF